MIGKLPGSPKSPKKGKGKLGMKSHSVAPSDTIGSISEHSEFHKKLWTKKNSDVIKGNMQDYSTFL